MRSRTFFRPIVALLASILVPTIAFALLLGIPTFDASTSVWTGLFIEIMTMMVIIAAGHAVVLGIPAALLLIHFNRLRWWTCGGAGFVAGALPTAVWLWPLQASNVGSSSSHRHADGEMAATMIDGVVTAHGWFHYLEALVFMGAFGLLGGLAFAFIWWRLRPTNLATNAEQSV